MTRYYLDTTAHVERHAGDSATKQAVEARLAGSRHASSTHVYREWRHIVEGGAVDILNVIHDGATTMPELYSRLAQGYGRPAGQRLRVLAMLAGQTLDLTLLAIRAETFLRSEAAELFRLDLDVVHDKSECGLAREALQTDARGRRKLRMECSRGECLCVQPEFLDADKSRVSAATTALASVTKYRKAAKRNAEAMGKADRLARTGKNCWRSGGLGGDLSIALECADDETLLTTDAAFDLIGPAVGIQVDRFPPTPPP